MGMRYLARRNSAEELDSIRREIPDLDAKLGKADKELRRFVQRSISSNQYITYQFFTRGSGANFIWVCPSVELVADNEAGLLSLVAQMGLETPAHLAHLK